MNRDFDIIAERRELPFNRFDVTYRLARWDWLTQKDEPVSLAEAKRGHCLISHALAEEFLDRPRWEVQPGQLCQVGPFRLRVIESNVPFAAFVCRLDGWRARAEWRGYRVLRGARWFYVRLILTAYVWGLADRHEAYPVTWRDVRFLNRLFPKRKPQ